MSYCNMNWKVTLRATCFIVVLNMLGLTAIGQTLSPTAPTQYNDLLARQAILSDSIGLHPLPFANNISDYYRLVYSDKETGTERENTFRMYIVNSFNEYEQDPNKSKKPILTHFYSTPGHMIEVNQLGFRLRVNPILNLKTGSGSLEGESYFLNTRGIEIRGSIDNKVHFYSNILENQGRFGLYVDRFFDRFNTLPGEGFVKLPGQSTTIQDGKYDWLDATGYIQFDASKHIGMTFGHTKNFIGDGYRSLILSDFADNYLQLRLDTRIGKFHYQNIFAELSAEAFNDRVGNNLLSKKYFTAHTLSFNPSDKINIYLFEAVVFGRDNGFELQYLNPLIFYRAVEGGLGSPDNVLLGIGSKYNLGNRIQIYGQFMLDEFRFEEIRVGNGWWANKFALQLGAKYTNALGIKNLDAQVEYNQARPFIYSHRDSLSSYAHYNQPLAHPLGANFRELIVKGRYNINHRWFFDATLMYAYVGEDTDTENFGNNILISHNTRFMNFGNTILQGVRSDILLGKLDLSFMLRHNLFIDLSIIHRDQSSDDISRDYKSTIINTGIRMNIRKREHVF